METLIITVTDQNLKFCELVLNRVLSFPNNVWFTPLNGDEIWEINTLRPLSGKYAWKIIRNGECIFEQNIMRA